MKSNVVTRSASFGIQAQLVMLIILAYAYPARSQSATMPASSSSSPEFFVRSADLARLQRNYDMLAGRSRELVALYMEAARREVLAETDGCFPHTGSMLYRNYAERAKGAAILSAIKGKWTDGFRQRCRAQAAGLVTEIALAHEKQPGFGDPWQSALFAAETAMAAWFLWGDLEPAARHAVAEMIVYHADRLAAVKPKMEYRGDTQAETVAWNSALLGAAVNIMPDHPHAGQWEEALKLYLYNTFAAPQDVRDETLGDDGRPVNHWILGANVHEDFALENHNQFHVDYILACFRFHLLVATCYQVAGRPLPKAIHHHAVDMYERILLHCMDRDGFFQYVSDNDWHRYHAWTESATVHSYLAFLEHQPLASLLEDRALANATRYWRQFPAGWSYDNPYVCGKPWTPRIAEAVLLHLTASETTTFPLPDEQLNARLSGVGELKSVRLLTQQSPAGSLRSYYAGPGRAIVRFITPSRNNWMFLPLGNNYDLTIGAKSILGREGELRCEHGPDWFWVVRTSARGGEMFVSLPDELVIQIQSLAGTSNSIGMIEQSIAIEKPHCPIKLWSEDLAAAWKPGCMSWSMADGSPVNNTKGNWINLDDSIGYVVLTDLADPAAEWLLPDPTKRSLLKRRMTLRSGKSATFAILAFPNQDHQETARTASQAKLAVIGAVWRVEVGDYVVWANLADIPVKLDMPEQVGLIKTLELGPRTVTATRSGRRIF